MKPMNPELRKIFMSVSSEVSWLHAVWEVYVQLFGTSDENLKIMDSVAPQYFAITKDALFDELMLILNQLTESAKTSGKDNASLEQLVVRIDQPRHEQLVKSLSAKLIEIRDKADPFRVWRNKRLAHHDLSTALKVNSNILPAITRGEIQDVINEVVNFINEFSIELQGEQQIYTPFLVHSGDGNALMEYLKRIELEIKRREA